VSKRLSAPHRSGPSRDWLKVKNPDSPAMGEASYGVLVMARHLPRRPHGLYSLSCHRTAQMSEVQHSDAALDRRAEPPPRTERQRNANLCMCQLREHRHAHGALGTVVQMSLAKRRIGARGLLARSIVHFSREKNAGVPDR
jgi:hypothetical protein